MKVDLDGEERWFPNCFMDVLSGVCTFEWAELFVVLYNGEIYHAFGKAIGKYNKVVG